MSDPERSLPFVQGRLAPVAPLGAGDSERIRQALRDLDSKRFAVRQEATRHLEKAGELAAPGLREALRGQPTAETRRRLEQLLEKLVGRTPEALRTLRAVEALERLGTQQARRALAR
jgi:hypothetical protein